MTGQTSGAIQKGVPTDVFRRRRALVNWAETPARDQRPRVLES